MQVHTHTQLNQSIHHEIYEYVLLMLDMLRRATSHFTLSFLAMNLNVRSIKGRLLLGPTY